jgi:TolB-like protein
MKKSLLLTAAILILSVSAGFSAPSAVKTMIGGFVNLGDKKQDNIGELTARSLYNLFAKIPGSDLVEPKDSLEQAKAKGILTITNGKELNAAMTKLAQQTGAGLVIFGIYKVSGNKLTVTVFGIDVVTADIKFQRDFSGIAGLDVFDTIDRITEEIAGVVLGKKIEFASLTVSIKSDNTEYRVYLNGKYIGKATMTQPFTEKVFAGEENEMTIVNSKNMKEVYREIFTLKKDEQKKVEYLPAGKIVVTVLNVAEPVQLKWNGEKVWDVLQGEPFQVRNVDITKTHKLEVVNAKGDVLGTMNITLEEGETAIANIDLAVGQRKFGMALKGLEGGLSLSIGVNYKITPDFKAGLFFGIMFYETRLAVGGLTSSSINNLLKFDLELSYYFMRVQGFPLSLAASVFGTGFLTTSGSSSFAVSPGIGLKTDIANFFIDLKARYSFIDNKIHPMLGVGISLDF